MARQSTLRASDADREHVVQRLRRAASEGRLLAEELEQRLGDALTARTYGQLEALVADLPMDRTPAPRSGASVYLRRAALVLGAVTLVAAALAVVALIVTGTIVAGGAWLFFGFMFFGCRRRYSRGYGRYPRYGCRVPAGRWR